MASPLLNNGPVGPDTLITVKVLIYGQNRRFKLALRDLGAHSLPQKLRLFLQISNDREVRFDRYSDSAGAYVTLDSNDPSIYKQLYRAAKAKLKLRLRATVREQESEPAVTVEKSTQDQSKALRTSYLETVLSHAPVTRDAPLSVESFQSPELAESSTRNSKTTATTVVDEKSLSRATLPSLSDFCSGTFSIECNNCGQSVPNEHYHCGICESGDYDLCQTCIDQGVTCDGDDHWMIKRCIKAGRVHPSITEILPPKKAADSLKAPETVELTESAISETAEEDERTCNGCIIQLPVSAFVTCQTCADYDLCFYCLEQGEHNHHPAHTFTPVNDQRLPDTKKIKQLCQEARGLRHEAICDGCDAQIIGVRHKCLSCPDFDYCSTCVMSSVEIHPGHRFAPLYEQLHLADAKKEHHRGIYCDGPVCMARSRRSYIRGDRYKCAVCHDTDFCADCEALPTNPHNKTHPLIKIKTPIRHVSITTVNEADNLGRPVSLGDRPTAKNAATETTRSTSTNAATQVQTMAEVKPVEVPVNESCNSAQPKTTCAPEDNLHATFESDSTPDGSSFGPNRLVSQSWTLKNPGPQAWPAGCAVHYIGGDDMRNVDDKHPSSVSTMLAATRSNVLEEALEPGNTAVFTVLLKSPSREGRAISYWRLKTPEGLPFGHKLWVDIAVASTPTENVVDVPASEVITTVMDKDEETTNIEGSTMIFPKLDKESPDASIQDIKHETIIATEPSIASEEQDLLEDLESMGLEDECTDDGFMTDEEYDILDAEDEDFLMEAQRSVQKK